MDWREACELIRERGRQFVSNYAKKELSWTDAGATLDIPTAWFAKGFLIDGACFTKRRLTPGELEAQMYANDKSLKRATPGRGHARGSYPRVLLL